MKRRINSNLRPLLCAFYPFLSVAAALWAMPRTARAQLYVTEAEPPQVGTIEVVGKYDAKTGAAISPSFITGLRDPLGLAVSGNTHAAVNFTLTKEAFPSRFLSSIDKQIPTL
jgi:hypothetical protein